MNGAVMERVKGKGGAPRKEIRQSKAFKVYLTPDEFLFVKQVAEKWGYPTISSLIREKALEFCNKGRISTANNPMIQAASAYLGDLAFACSVLEQYVDAYEVPEDVYDASVGLRGKIDNIEHFLNQ